jgi:hypothetical protein
LSILLIFCSHGKASQRPFLRPETIEDAQHLPLHCTTILTQKDVFNLAEIEKLSMKAGIVLPSVKEVLDSLRADDLVNSEKIGAGNFFWSFPSKAHQIVHLDVKLAH